MFTTQVNVLGWAAAILAAFMLLPAALSFGVAEDATGATFLVGSGLTLFVGGTAIIATRGTEHRIDLRGGFLTATLLWTLVPALAAIPFVLSGIFASFVDAYFEALSGFSTSGATILTDLESVPRGILLWRAILQWLGGFAIILFAVVLLSFGGVGGMNLFVSPMPRGDRDTLLGRTERAARSMWWIYVGLTGLCIFALVVVGMAPFDAAAHAFSTISTGGFSTRTVGIAAYDSVGVEIVLMIFMLVGALNFTMLWSVTRGRYGPILKDAETRYLLGIVLIASAIVVGALAAGQSLGLGSSVRTAAFDVISALTTTGYSASSSAASGALPVIVPVILIGLMLIGGATGSTAGGMRLMRLSVFFKLAGRELSRLSYPHGVVRLRYGGQIIDEPTLRSVWGQLMMFLSFLALGALVFGLLGFDLQGALALAATTLSTAGAGLALTAPELSYPAFSDATKWTIIAAMIIGRLELLVVLVLFTRAYWRS
ncbi:MAG: TrkH family potassium uptake protein [Proteobacteria bacterium]|nr:TrkH family potassium uptake protein [Pseudomonadota bacterium]MDA1058628.1 TrkH family potassium uptake protein [Pseudomonadota bacterium]